MLIELSIPGIGGVTIDLDADTVPDGATGHPPFDKITVRGVKLSAGATAGATVGATGTFAHPIDIPPRLVPAVATPGDKPKIDIAALMGRDYEDLRRRLAHFEVDWTDNFCGAKKIGNAPDLAGELTLRFDTWNNDDADVVAEFRLRITHQQTVAGAQIWFAYALAVQVAGSGKAFLAIELDDLGISLPSIPFPSLSLATAELPFVLTRAGVSRALSRLLTAQPVIVKVTGGSPSPQLKLDLAPDGTLNWAIWTDGPPAAYATLTADIGLGTAGTITQLLGQVSVTQASHDANGFVITGTLTPAPVVTTIRGRSLPLGPLRLEWDDIPVVLQASAGVGGGMITAKLDVARLTIWPAEDPGARLSVKGVLHVTPSHVLVERLSLLEPDPLDLITAVANDAERLRGGVARVLARLEAAETKAMARVLEVLGRLAASLARAKALAGEQAAVALSGVGRLLGDALRGLGRLLEAASGAIIIELRATIDPLAIRQLRVELVAASAPSVLRAAGLTLGIEQGWRPGVLVDFDNSTGVYLTASAATPVGATPTFAQLSTDLWLSHDNETTPLRDGEDAPTPGTAEQPLLDATLDWIDPTADGRPLILVIAGLSRGEPVFLKRVKAGNATMVTVSGDAAVALGDGFGFENISDANFKIAVHAQPDRLLPFLGGDPPGFLADLRQVVTLRKVTTTGSVENRRLSLTASVGIKAAGLETDVDLQLDLALDTLRVSIVGGDTLHITGKPMVRRAMGLVWVFNPGPHDALFDIRFADGEQTLALANGATMELRFPDASSDGVGIVFKVSRFRLGRGGLDLDATVSDAPVRLNGLDQSFRFISGGLSIAGGRLTQASISGTGQLPPALIGKATASIAITLGAGPNGIDIVAASGVLDRSGDPIVCDNTRFTLTLRQLGFAFVRDGGVHFYFLITGSARFTPKAGEFADGLLKYLPELEIDLDHVPLASDARVLARHISFQVPMHPAKRVNLFNLFHLEVRGIGFHPAMDEFDGSPAMSISGQISFLDSGDVVHPSIDFHNLLIAPPVKGTILPRIHCGQLTIDVELSGTARIAGSVAAVDGSMATLDAPRDLTPAGYKTYGFLGSGMVSIGGLGTMAASIGFLELERADKPGERKRAFFLYLEIDKVSYEIPTPIWPLFIREVGFGFGYRYTLEGLRRAADATSTSELISVLDDVSRRQGDLAKFTAWMPDPEEGDDPPRVTLALRAAVTLTSASEDDYNADEEKDLPNPFLFDMILALRSDMTLLISMRGYLSVNYADWLKAGADIRQNPGYRGYLFISAPRHELLGRFIADPQGYIGEHPPVPGLLKSALRSIAWSATLYIRPGLFHYELGWPDQLSVQLADQPNFKARVSGGTVFRISDGALLQGYNIIASAYFHFGGGFDAGWIGASVDASLSVGFTARLIAYIDTRKPSDTLFYGLFDLHASLEFRVSAWMQIDLWLTTITLRISFGVAIQLSAAVELAVGGHGVGVRANIRVSVSVFGCSLGVAVGFTIGDNALERARAQVQRFLSLGLTAATPDPARELTATNQNQQLTTSAGYADHVATGPGATHAATAVAPPAGMRKLWNDHDIPIGETSFWLVLRTAVALPAELGTAAPPGYFYGLLLPQDGDQFYATPPVSTKMKSSGDVELPPAPVTDHTLKLPAGHADIWWFDPETETWQRVDETTETKETKVNWAARATGGTGAIGWLMAQCYLWSADIGAGAQPDLTLRDFRNPPFVRLMEPSPPEGETPDEQARNRELRQRGATTAIAAERPEATAARDARALMLAQFIADFRDAAVSPPAKGAVTLLARTGLLLLLPASMFKNAASRDPGIGVSKRGVDNLPIECKVALFQSPADSFAERGVTLNMLRSERSEQGVHLDWTLILPPELTYPGLNDEHFVDHYEVVREVDVVGVSARLLLAKPVATLGALTTAGDHVTTKPAWQYTDDLADLPDALRLALLGSGDPDQAINVARDWREKIGAGNCRLLYTITPVDTLGTRGMAHSIVHVIEPPEAPIRPATAMLVLEVAGIEPAAGGATDRPDNLRVILGVVDPHWKTEEPTGRRRSYQLICEPEQISPSGFYGSDGLTGRLRTPLSLGGTPADATRPGTVFAMQRRDLLLSALPTGAAGSGLFVPPDDLGKASVWAPLAGPARDDGGVERPVPLVELVFGSAGAPITGDAARQDFLNTLWEYGSHRVANRFHLRTIVDVDTVPTPPGFSAAHVTLASAAVPVTIEVRLMRPADGIADPVPVTALRPDSFEWPIAQHFPPLLLGQIAATSGMARILMPAPGATLQSLIHDAAAVTSIHDAAAVTSIPDPDRRVMTCLEFDACHPDMTAHAAETLAGYDILELDLDTVAPSDIADPALENNHALWDSAKTIARVQLLPPDEAMLTPGDLTDLVRWQAHYPSTTWRANPSGTTGGAGRLPRAWYSRAESTPKWPDPMPCQRLMPALDEATVTTLFGAGTPVAIRVTLSLPPESPDKPEPRPGLALPTLRGPGPDFVLDTEFAILTDDFPHWEIGLSSDHMQTLHPRDVREILLRLSWADHWADRTDLRKSLLARSASGEIAVSLTPILRSGHPVDSASVRVPINVAGSRHPVLSETLALLTLKSFPGEHGKPDPYVGYSVETDPSPPAVADDLTGYLGKTGAGADPYGWGVLRQLGLAVSFRLYDLDAEAFVAPENLLKIVQDVHDDTLRRYNEHDPAATQPAVYLGMQFAEVLLRPGDDRQAAPFDGFSPPPVELALDDQALAMVQLSLRPGIAPTADYTVWSLAVHGDPLTTFRVVVTMPPAVDLMWLSKGSVEPLEANGQSIQTCDGASALGQEPDPRLIFLVRSHPGVAITPTFKPLVPNNDGTDWIDPPGGQTIEATSKAVAVPAEVAMNDPFGRFPTRADDDVATQIADALANVHPNDLMAENWRAFGHWLQRCSRKFVIATTTADIKAQFRVYGGWGERFLQYGAAPGDTGERTLLALAAQERPRPWMTAIGDNGRIGVSFLHQDRWGHVRGYAVRPLGRWLRLEGSLRANPLPLLSELGDGTVAGRPPVGYAVAVSRRTEPVAAPVLLQPTRLDPPAPDPSTSSPLRPPPPPRPLKVWDVAIARHPEQGLIESNRTVFGRMDFQGVMRSFVRTYRNANYPGVLSEWLGTPAAPTTSPVVPARPDLLAPAIAPTDLDGLIAAYPVLASGADLYRYQKLPYFFNATLLAAARAGIVVSPIVTTSQRDFDYFVPQGAVQGELETDTRSPAAPKVTITLIRYRDCLPPDIEALWGGPPGDFTDLPDPEIVYTVSVAEPKTALREEETEFRFLANQTHPDPIHWQASARWVGDRFGEAASKPAVTPGHRADRAVVTFELARRRLSFSLPPISLAPLVLRMQVPPQAGFDLAAFRVAIRDGLNQLDPAAVPEGIALGQSLAALCTLLAGLTAIPPVPGSWPAILDFRWPAAARQPVFDGSPVGLIPPGAPPSDTPAATLTPPSNARALRETIGAVTALGVSDPQIRLQRDYLLDQIETATRDPAWAHGLRPEPIPISDASGGRLGANWDLAWQAWAVLAEPVTIMGTDLAGLPGFRANIDAAIEQIRAADNAWFAAALLVLLRRLRGTNDGDLTAPGAMWRLPGALPHDIPAPAPVQRVATGGVLLMLIEVPPAAQLAAMESFLGDAEKPLLRAAARRMLLGGSDKAVLQLRAVRGIAAPVSANVSLPVAYRAHD